LQSLSGKSVLLTAGPTYEPIDPVRFIGNHSTGKMGYALAQCFAEAGATVYLISGPTQLRIAHPAIRLIPVTTAEEMYRAALRYAGEADIMVFAAAVADYRPKEVSAVKMKKKEDQLTLELVRNVDIAATLGQAKKPGQLAVGFALETNNEVENARAKLLQKNLDLIVLNSLQDHGAGFRHDTNKVAILDREKILTFDLKPKAEVARDIVAEIVRRLIDV
jgi:phosphopantothenoylcysteine decarboxylase / phosphopantothenate---cysteine ligase